MKLKIVDPIKDMKIKEFFIPPKEIKEVEGTRIEKHYCFSCGRQFDIKDAKWCPECQWAICPYCGSCACNLSFEAKMAIRGVWLTFCKYCYNPCKRRRKKRR